MFLVAARHWGEPLAYLDHWMNFLVGFVALIGAVEVSTPIPNKINPETYDCIDLCETTCEINIIKSYERDKTSSFQHPSIKT